MSLNDEKRKIDWRNECIFCGKKKTWRSRIWISVGYDSLTVTVCPECRKKHTIAELYGKIVRTLINDFYERW